MSGKRIQIMSYKQRSGSIPPITKPKYTHPYTHSKENLTRNDGASNKVNAKQLILYKDDVNSY